MKREINQERIETGNRLIAEFMEVKNVFRYETKIHGYMGLYIAEDEEGSIDYVDVGINWIDYDYSWDSLHEVMEKCWSLTTEDDRVFESLTLFELGLFTAIDLVWEAVIEFIEWYNNKKIK